MLKYIFLLALLAFAIHAQREEDELVEEVYTNADSDDLVFEEIIFSQRVGDGDIRLEATLSDYLTYPDRTATVICFYTSGAGNTVQTGDYAYALRFYCSIPECTSNQDVGISTAQSVARVS